MNEDVWYAPFIWGNFAAKIVSRHQYSAPTVVVQSIFAIHSIAEIGLELYVGHAPGARCPVYGEESATGRQPEFDPPPSGEAEDDTEEDRNDNAHFAEETQGYNVDEMRRPKGLDPWRNRFLTIVDITGIHYIRVKYCRCPDTLPEHRQLLRAGLYPSTQSQPCTAFTFQLLDDCHLENLECKTAFNNYYSKLRRITSKSFPHLVPDRYRELMRISRQWVYMKLRRWSGAVYDFPNDSDAPQGGLVLFCPACPQPGINLPENFREDPDQWKFMPTIMADGNFKAEQLTAKHPEDDVSLFDGKGFMVESAPYDAHLKATPDRTVNKSTCNEHRAVNQANTNRANLAVTGIGAAACDRHGCFFPHAVVNFQKGERQKNMDYAFAHAMGRWKGLLTRFLLLYDINCQYHKYLFDRLKESQHLSTVVDLAELIIRYGIGLFHVHGHNIKCYCRYAPTFIEGAGMIDGELIETLWEPLNHISGSIRAMSFFHRQETLDVHMSDSNWKKTTRIVPSILRKYKAAVKGVEETDEEYDMLCQRSIVQTNLETWLALEKEVHEARAQSMKNVHRMDVYEVAEESGPTRADMQLELAQEEKGDLVGAAAWLASGLKIEETQLAVAASARALPKGATVQQRAELVTMQKQLQNRIDIFQQKANLFLPLPAEEDDAEEDDEDGAAAIEFRGNEEVENARWDCDDLDFDEDAALPPSDFQLNLGLEDGDALPPERQVLALPSLSGILHRPEYRVLAAHELKLRIGQANDALRQLRMAIAQKSFLYRGRVRPARGSYSATTRAYSDVRAAQVSIQHAARIYSSARRAMVRLDAPPDVLLTYATLAPGDCALSPLCATH
ncbi:hypothetical protein EUX98_g7467 [Antrodiella citrinella]|uniref:CxC2-like cysteine cluster KDZ transposase-associated domain-containing protein n=1 Tax=Antrodiella citrinella TaxID=2447956 RepID=A0A4S4MLR4_9APHY|nr:hypothetical protein EUX98_g7467 [Antrodiella citrinella]